MNKKKAIIAVVGIIIIAVVIFLVTRDRHVQFDGAEAKTFEDPEFGITFSYPTGFVINANKIPEKHIVVSGEPETVPAILNVTIVKDETVFALTVNNPGIGFEGLPPPSRRDLNVDDHRVVLQTYSDEKTTTDFLVYYIEDNKNQFYFIARVPKDDTAAKTVFEDIIKSVDFTNTQVEDTGDSAE